MSDPVTIEIKLTDESNVYGYFPAPTIQFKPAAQEVERLVFEYPDEEACHRMCRYMAARLTALADSLEGKNDAL